MGEESSWRCREWSPSSSSSSPKSSGSWGLEREEDTTKNTSCRNHRLPTFSSHNNNNNSHNLPNRTQTTQTKWSTPEATLILASMTSSKFCKRTPSRTVCPLLEEICQPVFSSPLSPDRASTVGRTAPIRPNSRPAPLRVWPA